MNPPSLDRSAFWLAGADMLALLDSDDRFLEVNPAWLTSLGYAPSDLRHASLFSVIHPDDVRSVRARRDKGAREGRPWAAEARFRTRTGDYRLLRWRSAPRDGQHHAIAVDLTDQRAHEQRERAMAVMDGQARLAGIVAHDLNNLLTVILGNAEDLVETTDEGTDGLDQARLILSAAERAGNFIARLLTFAQRQPLAARPTSVAAVLTAMEPRLRARIDEAVHLMICPAPDVWPALVDRARLETALHSLVVNAVEAMPDGGRITLGAANIIVTADTDQRPAMLAPGAYVVMEVADQGKGVSEAIRARLFEPFFTTKPPGIGVGLGLSMVQGFARQSGGEILLLPNEGGGTRACLYLPSARKEALRSS